MFRLIVPAMVKVLSYTEVNAKLKDPKLVLLDVREPAELKTDGKIPKSNNIPRMYNRFHNFAFPPILNVFQVKF